MKKVRINVCIAVITLFLAGIFSSDNVAYAATLDENTIIGISEYSLYSPITEFGIANIKQTSEITYFGTELTDDFYFYRQTLSKNHKKVYDEIKQGLLKGEKTISITSFIVKDEIGDVYQAVIYDNPGLFWAEPGCSFSFYPGLNKVVSLTPQYNDLADDIEGNRGRIENSVEKALSVMSTLDSEVEIVKYAHDYITHNTNYVLDSKYNQNLYSVIVNGESVCAGYAHAFQYLMQKMGIQCGFIFGDSGGNHAWNIVELDDEYYAIDVTWDDPILLDPNGDEYTNPDYYRYKYFNITDQEMSKDHTRDEISIKLPAAYGTKYSYQNAFGGNKPGTDFDKKGTVINEVIFEIGSTKALLNWNKVDGVDGYTVYKYNKENNIYEIVSDVPATDFSCVVSGLNPSETYEFVVRAYRIVAGKKVYAERYYINTITTADSGDTEIPETTTAYVHETTTEYIVETTTQFTVETTSKDAVETTSEIVLETTSLDVGETTSKDIVTTTGKSEDAIKLPTKVKLKKLTAKRKKIIANWNIGAKSIKGYQLQYSPNKRFKKSKTITIKSRKITKRSLKKLKAKKKYFVRIRTYIEVSEKRYYSKWSGKKSIRTK